MCQTLLWFELELPSVGSYVLASDLQLVALLWEVVGPAWGRRECVPYPLILWNVRCLCHILPLHKLHHLFHEPKQCLSPLSCFCHSDEKNHQYNSSLQSMAAVQGHWDYRGQWEMHHSPWPEDSASQIRKRKLLRFYSFNKTAKLFIYWWHLNWKVTGKESWL